MHTDSPTQTPLFFFKVVMIPKITSQNIPMIKDAKSAVSADEGVASKDNPLETRNDKIKKQFREVADLYEKQFLREMTKSMRSTVQESGLVKVNQAEKIFREQLDGEYVEKWGAKGGIGISDLIYNNMLDRFGERMGLKEKVQKPSGPLELKEKDTYQIKTTKLPNSQEGMQFFFKDLKSADAKALNVQQPWTGYLAKKMELAPDEYFLEMNHDNGLTSQMHFKGKILPLVENQVIPEGQPLGYLSLDANQFSFSVKK